MNFEFHHDLKIFWSYVLQRFLISLRTLVYRLFWKTNQLRQLNDLIELFLSYLVGQHHGVEADDCFLVVLSLEAGEFDQFVDVVDAIVVFWNEWAISTFLCFFFSLNRKWFVDCLLCFDGYLLWCALFRGRLYGHLRHLGIIIVVQMHRRLLPHLCVVTFYLQLLFLVQDALLYVYLSPVAALWGDCGGHVLWVIWVVEVIHYFVQMETWLWYVPVRGYVRYGAHISVETVAVAYYQGLVHGPVDIFEILIEQIDLRFIVVEVNHGRLLVVLIISVIRWKIWIIIPLFLHRAKLIHILYPSVSLRLIGRGILAAILNYHRQHGISLLVLFSLFLLILLGQFMLYLFNNSFPAHRLAYCSLLPPRHNFWRQMFQIGFGLLHRRPIIDLLIHHRATLIHATLCTHWDRIVFSIAPQCVDLLHVDNRFDLIFLEDGSSCLHIWFDWSVQFGFVFLFLLLLQNICYHILFEKLVARSITIQQILLLLRREKTWFLQASIIQRNIFEGICFCIPEELWVLLVNVCFFMILLVIFWWFQRFLWPIERQVLWRNLWGCSFGILVVDNYVYSCVVYCCS